jgi:haloalkane dehalogenase
VSAQATTTTRREVAVPRGPYRLHAEIRAGHGAPIVLMHGFPDNVHLYDRLLPHLEQRPVVRFDFLGWGRSDKPAGYPYTADNQTGDLAAVVDHLGLRRVVVVAHDASGPPAIDWALLNPERVSALVLLNTYYHATPGLRRPPAIALYSTPGIRRVARAVARRWPDVDRRLYEWQVGNFIQDPTQRGAYVSALYEQYQSSRPAFWRLNEDLLGTIWSRRKRLPELHRFHRPVSVIFGARDRYLSPKVASRMVAAFPAADLHVIANAGHYVQVDKPAAVASRLLQVGD